jgi:excisionase family DNA binding protein
MGLIEASHYGLAVFPRLSLRLDTRSGGLNGGQVVIDRQRRNAVTETQIGAARVSASAGAVPEVATRERYLSPDQAAEYLNVSVGFIRRMASERRTRHYRLGKFIRFDPADLDAFAEVKEPLTGPDPALVTQVWRRSRRLS